MTTNEPLTISDLIRRHQDKTGDSLRRIADLTGLSKTSIAELIQGRQRRVLHGDTIEKLARGLRIPVSVVSHAALVSAGMTPPGPAPEHRLALIVAELERLSDDDLDTVEAVIASLVKRRG